MNSRERIKTILNKQIPDRMGLYEHFWPETIEDVWPKQGVERGEDFDYYFDFDIINCSGAWYDFGSFYGREDVIEETDEWKIVRNGRGATFKTFKNKSGVPEHISFEVTTAKKWKEYREPLLEFKPERVGDIDKSKEMSARAQEAGKYTVFGHTSFFEQMRATIGDEYFLPALALEPEWIRDFCQVYLDCFKKHYEFLFREAGVPDGFFIYEDMGYKTGLFCSPAMLEDLLLPYQKSLICFFKDYGLDVIIHSCGNIKSLSE